MSIQPSRLYIAKESVPGTPVVPVVADVQHFDSVLFTAGGPGPLDREAVLAQHDTLAPDCLPFERWDVALVQAVKHAVTEDGPLEIENQLLAGGFEATVNAGVDRTYTLAQDPNNPAVSDTVYLEENSAGDLYEASGLRWGLSFAGDNAGRLVCTLAGVGRYKDPTSSFTPIGAGDSDYHAGKNFCNLNGSGSMDWHGYGLEAQAFTLEVGLTPENRDHMAGDAADYGLAWPADLSRGGPRTAVSGSLTFRGVQESVFALWNRYSTVAAGPGVITYGRGGASLSFQFAETVFRAPTPSYEGAKKMWDLPFTAHYDPATSTGALVIVSIGAAP